MRRVKQNLKIRFYLFHHRRSKTMRLMANFFLKKTNTSGDKNNKLVNGLLPNKWQL